MRPKDKISVITSQISVLQGQQYMIQCEVPAWEAKIHYVLSIRDLI